MCPGRVTKIHPSLPLSKDEGLKDIEDSMRIENLILDVYSVTIWYLIRYDGLLQNATEVYYKMQQLVQIATTLLQNATVITKCDVYYKLRQYNN